MATPEEKKGGEAAKAKINGKTHVKPGKKLGRHECQLVTFDLPYLTFYYNQKLLFYKGGDFEDMVEKLKNGLEAVLQDFYQLGGKLGRDEEGVFRVEYDDEMEGVEVLEAVAEEIAIADLSAEEGTNTLKEMIPYNGVLNLEGLHRPLLAVQFTKLRDGLAIGCAFNHAIVDGTSTWHFMSSWAQICSGLPTSLVPPFLERTKARDTRVKLNLPVTPDPHASANGDAKEYSDPLAPSNGNTKADADPLVPSDGEQKLREKLFRFSEDKIDKIKAQVNANLPSNGSKPFSTFQSLSAHIWRHVTHARNLKPEDYTVFAVFADCRKRVDPPMPESYFGNLIQAIFTVTAGGLLLANQAEFGATLIQKAIDMHNAKAIEERNKEWESAPKIFQYKDVGPNCVAVGSSPRFKVYDVDFGWGKPAGVRSGCNNRFDGMVYLYQGKSGGRSIDVEMCLETGAMERLENDKEFLLEA